MKIYKDILNKNYFFLLFIYLYELPKQNYIELNKFFNDLSNSFLENNSFNPFLENNKVDRILQYIDEVIKKDSLLNRDESNALVLKSQ